MNTTDLQQIEFADATLDVVPDPDERTWWVSLRRACEGIGIKYSTQRRKLTGQDTAHWARVTTMNVRDADGRLQDMTMIDRATMLRWLVTISPGRVADDARDTLIAFQARCVEVLDAHFFGDDEPAPEPAPTPQPTRLEPADTDRLVEHVIEHADGTREVRRYGTPTPPDTPRLTEAPDPSRKLRELRATVADVAVDELRGRFHDALRRVLYAHAADMTTDQRAGVYRHMNRRLVQTVGKPRDRWTQADYLDAVRWLDEAHGYDIWSIFDGQEAA